MALTSPSRIHSSAKGRKFSVPTVLAKTPNVSVDKFKIALLLTLKLVMPDLLNL